MSMPHVAEHTSPGKLPLHIPSCPSHSLQLFLWDWEWSIAFAISVQILILACLTQATLSCVDRYLFKHLSMHHFGCLIPSCERFSMKHEA